MLHGSPVITATKPQGTSPGMVVCCAQLSPFGAEELPMSGELSWGGMAASSVLSPSRQHSSPQTVSWLADPGGESLHPKTQRRQRAAELNTLGESSRTDGGTAPSPSPQRKEKIRAASSVLKRPGAVICVLWGWSTGRNVFHSDPRMDPEQQGPGCSAAAAPLWQEGQSPVSDFFNYNDYN